MHELPPTGVRGRVGISFKLGVFVLPKLLLFHRRMRLFVYYLGFRSPSLFLVNVVGSQHPILFKTQAVRLELVSRELMKLNSYCACAVVN